MRDLLRTLDFELFDLNDVRVFMVLNCPSLAYIHPFAPAPVMGHHSAANRINFLFFLLAFKDTSVVFRAFVVDEIVVGLMGTAQLLGIEERAGHLFQRCRL
jgi:hypothetical protein